MPQIFFNDNINIYLYYYYKKKSIKNTVEVAN